MATLTFIGAASEVTGSCHLLELANGARLLLDCGMHQGGDDVRRISRDVFPFKPATIQAVILSHAHLDHSGLLPRLVREGFTGSIHCTGATHDLLSIMLRDSHWLYTRDLERENRRLRRAGRKIRKPAYEAEDVEKVLARCEVHDYHDPFFPLDGIQGSFFDAGHILGSASVHLTLHESGRTRRIVYSGDLGNNDAVLMRDREVPADADLVLMEGTYGNRNHRPMKETIEQFRDILHETRKREGNVLIPAFAVGRTQEILFHLGRLYHQGELDNWQVFLDSPMAIAVTRLYDDWIRLLDTRDVREISQAHQQSIRKFLPSLSLCESVDESMSINRIRSGAIIIAGSGMCTGGRIRHHIRHRIWNHRNTMIFIGFQARGTLGRLIVDGAKRVRFFGEEYAIKARIETLGGFSAHAGQRELIDWASAFDPGTRFVLVHGEPESLETLSKALGSRQGFSVLVPSTAQTTEV